MNAISSHSINDGSQIQDPSMDTSPFTSIFSSSGNVGALRKLFIASKEEQSLKQANFPNISFWKQGDWSKVKKELGVTSINTVSGPRGKEHLLKGENMMFQFIQFANGDVISADRVTDYCKTCHAIWHELVKQSNVPHTWGIASIAARDTYRSEMEAHYPELQLCARHWKVDQIAMQTYSDWHHSWVRECQENTAPVQSSGNKQRVPAKAKSLANAAASTEDIITDHAPRSSLDTQNGSAANSGLVSDTLPDENSELPLRTFRVTVICFYAPQHD